MSEPIDLQPAGERMIRLIEAVPADGLERQTPCEAYAVGDLLHHISGFPVAFRAAAVKEPLDGGASGDVANLDPDWRTRIPADIEALVEAWRAPEAWEGMTAAGGVDLPGDVAGIVALDELVLHGWDLAKAIGEPAGYDGPGLEAMYAQVQEFRAAEFEGLFGPEVPVPGDAPLFDRILGLTGRDPAWTPSR